MIALAIERELAAIVTVSGNTGRLAIGQVGPGRAGTGADIGMIAFIVERVLATVRTRIAICAISDVGSRRTQASAAPRLVAIAIEGEFTAVLAAAAGNRLTIGDVGTRRADSGADTGMTALTVIGELTAVLTRIANRTILGVGPRRAQPGSAPRLIAIAVKGVLAAIGAAKGDGGRGRHVAARRQRRHEQRGGPSKNSLQRSAGHLHTAPCVACAIQ